MKFSLPLVPMLTKTKSKSLKFQFENFKTSQLIFGRNVEKIVQEKFENFGCNL